MYTVGLDTGTCAYFTAAIMPCTGCPVFTSVSVCDQVDVSEEEDQFQAVTTSCLTVLILAVETRLDTALLQMTRVPWATLETVSQVNTNTACLDSMHAQHVTEL